MAFTKINAAGIGSTETVTLHSLEVLNNATVGGVLTYEDVTNVDSVGLITARAGIVVGSGITLSKDGDIFATGVTTSTTFVGALTGTASGNPTLTSGANNRVVTATGANAITGESNLTFTGSILTVTNSSGAAELTLVTPNDTDGGVYFNDGSNTGALTYQHSDDSMRFRVNSTEKLRITSDGDMGMDTSPQNYSNYKTFTVGAGSVGSIIALRGATSNFQHLIQNNNGSLLFEADVNNTSSSTNMLFKIDGSEKLHIASNGNIGIGTANPAKTVHINGIISGFQIAPHALGFDIGVTEGNIAPHYGSDFILYNGVIGSGTERFRCSADGYVTKPNHPSFFAYMDGGNQTTSANNTIPFNQTHHNTGGHFKTSGTNAYKFVAPVSGHYHFSGAVWMKNTGTGSHARYQLRRGGTIMAQAGWHQNATSGTDDFLDHSAPISATIYCTANDVVHLFADYDITYWRGGGGHPHTFFTGHLIG